MTISKLSFKIKMQKYIFNKSEQYFYYFKLEQYMFN